MPRSKRFKGLLEQVDRERLYPVSEAMSMVKQSQSAKFVETVEIHIRLGVDVRHAEEQVRGTMVMPHGLGREVSVVVFAEGDKAREAEEAGADHVGSQDLVKKIESGWSEFDLVVSTPDMMSEVGKLGRVLGPQGKMPNPKAGTVTQEVGKAVGDAKAGKVEYRTDRGGIVHQIIGRTDFDEDKLIENYTALLDEIVRAKPSVAKGKYIFSITLSSTMGPGIKVNPVKSSEVTEEVAA